MEYRMVDEQNELKFTIEQEKEIYQYYFESGWSVRRIASHYDIHPDKIVVIIQAA
jgi:hypothetical protein